VHRHEYDLSSTVLGPGQGALTLNPAVFDSLGQYSQSRGVAIAIILLAGLSQAIGQSIVLFANRVKPFRFVLSLGTAALIYFATYLLWVLSIWFVVDVIFQGEFKVISIATALALCYAPQLLGFLVAFPYFGMPIAISLSIWTLLAILVGLEATTTLNGGQTMLAAGLGWVVLHLGQRTIGRPLTRFADWLTTRICRANSGSAFSRPGQSVTPDRAWFCRHRCGESSHHQPASGQHRPKSSIDFWPSSLQPSW
jgi:hypothetical protein